MGSFVTGLLSGGVSQVNKRRKSGQKGRFDRKKKKEPPGQQGSDETDYEGTMQFKRGGKVKRTGLAKVHKGERVLTKRQQKRFSKRR